MKNKRDKFESFISDRLSKVDPSDTWNIPDDSNWDMIEASLERDDKEKKKGLILILPIIIGLSFLSVFFFTDLISGSDINSNLTGTKSQTNKQLDSKKKTNSANEVKIDDTYSSTSKELGLVESIPESRNTTNINQTKPSTNSNIKSDQQSRNNKESNIKTVSNDLVNDKIRSTIYSKENAFQVRSSIRTSNNDLNSSASDNIINTKGVNKKEIQPLLNAPSNAMININYLYSDFILLESDRELLPSKEIEVIEKEVSSNHPLSFYTAYQQIFALNHEIPEGGLAENIVGESTNNNYRVEVGGQYNLNENFSIHAGLAYSQFRINTDYEISLPYIKADELEAGSLRYNEFSHSFPTSTGKINTDYIMARSSESGISDEENLEFDLEHSQQVQYLSIPIGVTYNKSGFTIQGSLLSQYRIAHTLEGPSISSKHASIDYHSSTASFAEHDISKFQVSLRYGIGYQFPVSNKITFGVNALLQSDLKGAYYLGQKKAISDISSQLRLVYHM